MSARILQPIATATDNSANWSAFAATKAGAVDLPNDDVSTYIQIVYSDTGRQSYTLTATRGIPTTSTITAVTGFCRMDGPDCSNSQTLRAFTRLAGNTDNLILTLATPSAWTTYSGALPRPGGGSWTPANINDLTLELGVNLNSWVFVGGLPGVRVTTLYLQATFTQAAPSVTTDPATSVNVNSATLNGTLNPNGATAQFPVSFYFQWGTTAAYGNVTTTATGNTGSAALAVSTPLTGLSSNTTYHYRLVGTNTDNTVNGADRTFSTGLNDTALMVF